MKHTLSVVVEDESGALSRIAGLFARRGFNIDSLAVGPAETKGQSRLTMVVEGDEQTLQQMTKQLDKLVNVLQVLDLTRLPAVERDRALELKLWMLQMKHLPLKWLGILGNSWRLKNC